ncbi:MAG: hypothetical protein ACP5D6_07325 [Kosmotogaceae bacterium]
MNILDNTVLSNFASISQLQLLEQITKDKKTVVTNFVLKEFYGTRRHEKIKLKFDVNEIDAEDKNFLKIH